MLAAFGCGEELEVVYDGDCRRHDEWKDQGSEVKRRQVA